jgi:hypothetical protein
VIKKHFEAVAVLSDEKVRVIFFDKSDLLGKWEISEAFQKSKNLFCKNSHSLSLPLLRKYT